jgi:hypothetical protein
MYSAIVNGSPYIHLVGPGIRVVYILVTIYIFAADLSVIYVGETVGLIGRVGRSAVLYSRKNLYGSQLIC